MDNMQRLCMNLKIMSFCKDRLQSLGWSILNTSRGLRIFLRVKEILLIAH